MKLKVPTIILPWFPIALVFYELVNYFANDAHLPAFPSIALDLHCSNHWVQLSLTFFYLGNIFMQFIMGPLVDRYGCRPVLFSGGLVFIASTLACAYSNHIYALLSFRVIQGSAVTSMVVAGYSTIHTIYNQQQVVKVLAWMNSVSVLTPAFAPSFGALFLLMGGSWHWIFIALSLWAALGLLGLYRVMPETTAKMQYQTFTEILQQYRRVFSTWAFLKPALSLGLLFAFIVTWRTAAGPFFTMDTLHYHLSLAKTLLIQTGVLIAFVAGTRLTSRSIAKISIKRIMTWSANISFVGGLLCFIVSFMVKEQLWTIVTTVGVTYFAAGIGYPVFSRSAIEGSDQPMAIRIAVVAICIGLGSLFGNVLISEFYVKSVFGFSSVMLIIGCAIWLIHHDGFWPRIRALG